MYEIKCIGILPVKGDALAIRVVMGTDAKRSFVATFDKPGQEPDAVSYGPSEGQPGDWASEARYQGEVYYLGDKDSIMVDDLNRTNLQTTFEKLLRDSYV
jgi:hypothetical protein